MMRFLGIIICLISICGCNSAIKNEKKTPKIVEEKRKDIIFDKPIYNTDKTVDELPDLLGYWVGFLQVEDVNKDSLFSYSFFDGSGVKITFSIDKIINDSVIGHSVYGAYIRAFNGKIIRTKSAFRIFANEPGDIITDGEFNLTIPIGDSTVNGDWLAYKNSHFAYKRTVRNLEKKAFNYNKSDSLTYPYLDFDKKRKINYDSAQLKEFEYTFFDEETGDSVTEMEGYEDEEYYTSSSKLFEKNPSEEVLNDEFVETLTKLDLILLRNSIFARHGYAFTDKKLRLYFSLQDWYMPVFGDVSQDLTAIEKKNIDLMLRYEENAEEYYDTFGRY
jgi:hypothetical protein